VVGGCLVAGDWASHRKPRCLIIQPKEVSLVKFGIHFSGEPNPRNNHLIPPTKAARRHLEHPPRQQCLPTSEGLPWPTVGHGISSIWAMTSDPSVVLRRQSLRRSWESINQPMIQVRIAETMWWQLGAPILRPPVTSG